MPLKAGQASVRRVISIRRPSLSRVFQHPKNLQTRQTFQLTRAAGSGIGATLPHDAGTVEPARSKGQNFLKPYLVRLNELWCNSSWFQSLVRKAFNEADIDKNGKLSKTELYVCVLRVYERVNSYTTSHVKAPKKQEVFELMHKFDVDEDNALTLEEFLNCSRAIFGIISLDHSVPINVIVIMSLRMFILPMAARLIVDAAGYIGGVLVVFSLVPIALYSVLLEIMLRTVWSLLSD